MKSLWLFMFATTAGFTASGIVASLYRIAGLDANESGSKIARTVIMIFAWPTVFFEAAVRGYLAKEWSAPFFWFVAAVLTYWSLALGLLVLDIALKF